MLMFVSFLFHVISIHAPREGSDQGVHDFFCRARQISIHAPREGSDQPSFEAWQDWLISIHAPREGSDPERPACCRRCRHFYPRSPRGERRQHPPVNKAAPPISIHAPREGSDVLVRAAYHPHRKFLSTLPARGATSPGPAAPSWKTAFLSTLPARGATEWSRHGFPIGKDFYPRSPRGERRFIVTVLALLYNISIHAPREGSDPGRKVFVHKGVFISIHAPREGSDIAENHETFGI